MYKHKITYFLFFFSFSLLSSQIINFKSNIQIIYNLKYKSNLRENKFDNDIVCLYLGDKRSIFQNENKFKIDSIIANQKIIQLPAGPMFKVNHVIFKDFDKGEMIFSELIDKINIGYMESIPIMEWKLIDEKKQILGYNCQKAETTFRGRNYTAWYTNEIGISDGPYKFSGLPGLILEVFDNDNNFHYSLLQIISKDKNVIFNKSVKYIDRKKMQQIKINNLIKNSNTNSTLTINPIEKN
ncbi:GLPGLI family protein [Chryseobacterium takakiae]|uniref:GLPGLI family protein n=1 Tax=Chryseobacterium takakiae TaxID=1302685 RepID=A0A1M4YNV3_9FLAO|nr:GLPGLI family protein [Chryseobacterium takakiae]SHF07460.1 GLPGLI family protein [Chryseobacterium takakiae]